MQTVLYRVHERANTEILYQFAVDLATKLSIILGEKLAVTINRNAPLAPDLYIRRKRRFSTVMSGSWDIAKISVERFVSSDSHRVEVLVYLEAVIEPIRKAFEGAEEELQFDCLAIYDYSGLKR